VTSGMVGERGERLFTVGHKRKRGRGMLIKREKNLGGEERNYYRLLYLKKEIDDVQVAGSQGERVQNSASEAAGAERVLKRTLPEDSPNAQSPGNEKDLNTFGWRAWGGIGGTTTRFKGKSDPRA